MPDTTYTSGSGNWTCPNGVRKVQVLCWGGGGAGGGQNQTSDGGGGGGGGAFAENIDAVTPATTYAYAVGSGGTGVASSQGNAGGNSTWRTNVIVAEGGKGGSPSTGTPPIGGVAGLAANSTGRGKYNGGYGARGRDHSTGIGGYGGSSAGIGAAGVSTSADTAYVQNFPGGNPTGSGAGGNGATGSPGGAGTAPGGAGGGSGEGSAAVGGAGAAGQVIVRYIPPNTGMLLGVGT